MEMRIKAGSANNKPLVKKYGLFNSGMVPLIRYERDMHLIHRLNPHSLRFDLYMGDRSMEFGDLVDGTPDNIIYHFEKFDRFIGLLKQYHITPYISWCYIPLPLQPPDGDFRSYPVHEEKYYDIIRTLSAHVKVLMDDCPYYEEIYNEADCKDVFFTGTFQQFLRLYELGSRAVRDAGSTAFVGGPAEAYVMSAETVAQNMREFITYVKKRHLPFDFFSFHSYGHENKEYIARTHEVLALLQEYNGADPVEVHLNEVNVEIAPWSFGETMLETPRILPHIFTLIEDFSEETGVALIHWAQFLSSGIDALGMVDVNGKLTPAFFAFEIFGRMAVPRIETEQDDRIGSLASIDSERFSAVFWNKSPQPLKFTLQVENLAPDFATGDVFVLDESFFGLLRQRPQLSLEAAIRERISMSQVRQIQLGPQDVVYVESNATR